MVGNPSAFDAHHARHDLSALPEQRVLRLWLWAKDFVVNSHARRVGHLYGDHAMATLKPNAKLRDAADE